MKELPPAERPREKIMSSGVFSLSNAELIAVLIGSGSATSSAVELANTILAREGSLADFANYQPEEFMQIPGIGPAKSCVLTAALELGRRVATSTPQEVYTVEDSRKAAALFMEEMRYLKHECFAVAMLNTKNQLLMKKTISIGSLNSSFAHPREVFSEAIKKGAGAVILCHNHPSGDPTPSDADIQTTKQLVESGEILGISVADHIVIGNGRYISFREKHLL